MDLIDRQAVLDVLNKHSIMFGYHLPVEFYEVKEEIRGLPSVQPEQKWIPVTERLPEKVGTYLVTTNRNNVYLWYYNTATTIEWQRLLKAWMPVPEPYQE